MLTRLIRVIFLWFFFTLLMACQPDITHKKIGIVLPIEHQALNEIVEGFKETLTKETKIPIAIKVANAQGDINLQRAIIQQMKDQEYDLIVPIGLAVTETAIALVRDRPILSLATNLDEKARRKSEPCHIAVVHDEIPPEKMINFIHTTYPQIKKMVLIHSASEKIYPDVKAAIIAGRSLGIIITPMMINNLSELYNIAQAIPDSTQVILVLKDNLIVSGISTLANVAAKRKIPLISADEGSVENGAAFALGIPEKQTGVEGAKLAARILAGEPICNLPIVETPALSVFINSAALVQQGQCLAPIEKNATHYRYNIRLVASQQKSI